MTGLTDVDQLEELDLSLWFNPFLPHFMREALRCGGEVKLVREGERIVALVLADPTENIASVFTRTRPLAEALCKERPEVGCFSEFELDGPREAFEIYSRSMSATEIPHRFRHRVQIAPALERASIMELMKESYRGMNDRWFRSWGDREETCFSAHVEGTLAGVAWVSVVGEHGRLHSLTVRPGFRRLGIGVDLLFARLLWARAAGVREVLSEISEHNTPSKVIAERGGMRSIGRMYLSGRS